MPRFLQLIVIGSFTILVLLCLMTAFAGPPTPKMAPVRSTVMTPHLEGKITHRKNLVYCATFQVAWNQLQDRIIKAPLRLAGRPRDAEILNRQQVTADILPAAGFLAKAGQITEEFLDRLNYELKAKFDPNAPSEVKEVVLPGAFLSYAYLYKAIVFPHEFEALEKPIAFGNATDDFTPVEGFGINECHRNSVHQNLRQQVTVGDYRNNDDFILTLTGSDPDDILVLAKVKPESTLLSTIQSVEARINKAVKTTIQLQEDETLQIPKIALDLDISYPQFEGAQILNEGCKGSMIAKARQLVRFNLDQKGAVVKSEARIIIIRGALTPVRNFIFDKPFLVYMKKKTSPLPYLALWLATPDWFQAAD